MEIGYEKHDSTLSKPLMRTKHIVALCVFVMMSLMATLVGIAIKELQYVHQTLDIVHEILPESKETLQDIRLMERNVRGVKHDIDQIKQIVEFNLEMLIRFCRIDGFMEHCLMPVPDDYNYTISYGDWYVHNATFNQQV